MNNLFSFVTIITAIVTAFVAVIGILLTWKQIKINNKHHLFDKRINSILFVEELLTTYKQNRTRLNNEKNEGLLLTNDFEFTFLTNNTYLEAITAVIGEPLKEEEHKKFLYKLEDMKKESIKIEYLFSKGKGEILSEFIIKYKELLFSMYQYQILLIHIKEQNDKNVKYKILTTAEDLSEQFGEKKYKEKYVETLKNLEVAYLKIGENNIIEKVRKETHILKS
ncbi:MAG: hypothetical protein ACK5HR_03225 [Mycoplasmatales bacterium]